MEALSRENRATRHNQGKTKENTQDIPLSQAARASYKAGLPGGQGSEQL
jgi:hypothetical protein